MVSAVNPKGISVSGLLKAIPLFAGLSDTVQAAFVAAAVVKSVPKGRVLYIEQEVAEFFYIVQSGWVKLFHETLDGSEAVMDILTHGHLCGETSVFDGGIYTSSAQAVEDAILISLPTSLLKTYIEQNPKLAMNMLSSMAHHRKLQDKEIEHLTVQNAPQRIGCFLLRLCPQGRDKNIVLQLPYDKMLLASRLGMKPETFSRALKVLREQTGIRVSGARVEIDNISQLSNFSCSACSSAYPCEDL